MGDKYMRAWDAAGGVHWIVTDDAPKHNAMYPAETRDAIHTGSFKSWSKRWCAIKQLMREEFRWKDYEQPKQYRFPLELYVRECETIGVNPFPKIKVSQVVTTYEDEENK